MERWQSMSGTSHRTSLNVVVYLHSRIDSAAHFHCLITAITPFGEEEWRATDHVYLSCEERSAERPPPKPPTHKDHHHHRRINCHAFWGCRGNMFPERVIRFPSALRLSPTSLGERQQAD